MKEWTHDKLHQLIDNDSALRAKSNEVHNMPTPKSLDEWEKQKRQMMRLYAKTIGCEGFVDAENFLNKVLGYIKQHCSCLEDWRNIALLQKHREALQALGESFKEHKNVVLRKVMTISVTATSCPVKPHARNSPCLFTLKIAKTAIFLYNLIRVLNTN